MQVDWTAITIGVGTVSAVVYLLILGVVLTRRGLQERSGRALALYAAVSFLWIVLLVLGQLKKLGNSSIRTDIQS